MSSAAERTVQLLAFGLLVAMFWYGAVPMALGMIEDLLGLRSRRR